MIRHCMMWVVALAGAALVAGCVGTAGPSAASPSATTPSATPSSAATPGPNGVPASGYRLRATMTQATPPITRFGWLPVVAITGDLQVVVAGPMVELYPGPLLPNLQARPLSAEGFAKIVKQARTLGLLSGKTDFTPPDVPLGAQLGRMELLVDGVRYDLVGDPSRVMTCVAAPCTPAPGTPEAFAAFWQSISDLTWLEADLGPEAKYVAEAYALLAGVDRVEEPSLPPKVMTWPLEPPLSAFGTPVGSGPAPRCGTVRGADAEILRPSLEAANQLTLWVDKGAAAGAGTSLQVRPMVPGEDVCLELFGIDP